MKPQTITLPGVFVCVYDCGVLLQGESGIGKSTLALNLIDRGHQLIADDAVTFEHTEDKKIIGYCPTELENQIEIRGFGIVNLQQINAHPVIKKQCPLDMIIQLKSYQLEQRHIVPIIEKKKILEQEMISYQYAMPNLSTHNASLVIELIVKYHLQNIFPTIHSINSFCTQSLGQII